MCENPSGIKVGEADVRMLLYTNYEILPTESAEKLQVMLEELELSTRRMDLKIIIEFHEQDVIFYLLGKEIWNLSVD
jgi:hypothetical protein